MKLFLFMSFGIIILLLTACSSGKPIANKNRTSYQEVIISAWNEDNVNSFHFTITSDKRFVYRIVKNNTQKSKQSYYGTVINQPFSDTLFLNYKDSNQPTDFRNYLIREASGSYLIQQFEHNAKSIFMRKQRLGHRF